MTTLDVRLRAAATQPALSTSFLRRAQRSKVLRQTLLALGDSAVLIVAALAAYMGRFGLDSLFMDAHPDVPSWLAHAIPALWIVVIAAAGGYSLPHLQTGMVEYQRITLASGITAGALGVACFLSKYDLSRGYFVLLFVIAVPALLVLRLGRRRLMKRLRTKGLFQSPVLVAGSPAHIDEVAQVLRREKWLGYQIIGAVTPADIEETACGLPVLGKVCEVVDLVRDSDVHTVIFAEGSFPDSQHFKRMAWDLEEHSTQMIVAPLPMVTLLGMPTWPHSVTPSSITTAPAMATCAQIKQCGPINVSWPTCTWLSIFVPRPMRVSALTPRSMVQSAPISTSSSITTLPQGIILSKPVARFLK